MICLGSCSPTKSNPNQIWLPILDLMAKITNTNMTDRLTRLREKCQGRLHWTLRPAHWIRQWRSLSAGAHCNSARALRKCRSEFAKSNVKLLPEKETNKPASKQANKQANKHGTSVCSVTSRHRNGTAAKWMPLIYGRSCTRSYVQHQSLEGLLRRVRAQIKDDTSTRLALKIEHWFICSISTASNGPLQDKWRYSLNKAIRHCVQRMPLFSKAVLCIVIHLLLAASQTESLCSAQTPTKYSSYGMTQVPCISHHVTTTHRFM